MALTFIAQLHPQARLAFQRTLFVRAPKRHPLILPGMTTKPCL